MFVKANEEFFLDVKFLITGRHSVVLLSELLNTQVQRLRESHT